MKIAVYTICGAGEAKHVEKFLETTKDADHVYIAMTVEDKETLEKMPPPWHRRIHVSMIDVQPFRFDVARNAALALVPPDIDFCISLDMDEELGPGWREAIERCLVEAPGTTRIWANYKSDGLEGFYHNSRVHARHGYYWDHPCHECLQHWMIDEKQALSKSLNIFHHPDITKPRTSYLPMLEAGLHERPYDRRRIFYYGRELVLAGMHEAGRAWLAKYMELWKASGEDFWQEPQQAQAFIDLATGILAQAQVQSATEAGAAP